MISSPPPGASVVCAKGRLPPSPRSTCAGWVSLIDLQVTRGPSQQPYGGAIELWAPYHTGIMDEMRAMLDDLMGQNRDGDRVM